MNALFIGGVWDGQRHKVSESPYIRVPRLVDDEPSIIEFCELSSTVKIEYDEYRVLEIRGEHERHAFFILNGMQPDEAIKRLLCFYKPK